MAPRGSQAWTPQPLFVILMSYYIFVWAWAGETRSVKHVVTLVLLEFHPPVGLTRVTMGFVLIEKISVDSIVSIRSAYFAPFSPFCLFNKEADLFFCLYYSSSFTIYFFSPTRNVSLIKIGLLHSYKFISYIFLACNYFNIFSARQ